MISHYNYDMLTARLHMAEEPHQFCTSNFYHTAGSLISTMQVLHHFFIQLYFEVIIW
jgi:hypothetical protein